MKKLFILGLMLTLTINFASSQDDFQVKETTFSTDEFTEDLTVISLNPTWDCGPCKVSNYMLNNMMEVLQSEHSIELKTLHLEDDELKQFYITGLPSILIYKGETLVEVLKGVNPSSEYMKYFRRHGLTNMSDDEFDETRKKLEEDRLLANKKALEERLRKMREEAIQNTRISMEKELQRIAELEKKTVRTCISYETKRVQTGGLLQWSKARGGCLVYDVRVLQEDEKILKTCTEYEYKSVQVGGLLQRKKVRAFCKKYDVDTILKN